MYRYKADFGIAAYAEAAQQRLANGQILFPTFNSHLKPDRQCDIASLARHGRSSSKPVHRDWTANELSLTAVAIAAENINYKWQDEEDKPPLCSFALTSPPAVYGDNHLGLTLITSAADADDDIILDEVEVIVLDEVEVIVKTGD